MSTAPYDETGPLQPSLPPQGGYAPQEPQQQAQQAVVLDLDAIQAEKRSERSREIPFTTRIGGRVITFTNPKGLDWQDLLDLGDDPADFVELCIADADEREHVMAQRIDSDVMETLISRFMAHYGMGDRSRGGRGNRGASRR